MGSHEESVRLEVCDRIGRELPDGTWDAAYARATQKLRHIVTHFGDEDGARSTVGYLAQLVIEAIRAEAMTQHYRAMYISIHTPGSGSDEEKGMGADTNADPRGHTNIILQRGQRSQAPCSVTA